MMAIMRLAIALDSELLLGKHQTQVRRACRFDKAPLSIVAIE